MTPRKRRWLAALLGTGLVLVLVVLASLDTLGNPDAPERFELTEVTTYEAPLPPPPPPPPGRRVDTRSGGSTGAQMKLESRRAPAALDTMQLDVKLAAAAEPSNVHLGGLGQGVGVGVGNGTGDGNGTGFELATLSELDQQPV
jgi:hypothetical protein